MLEPSQEFRYRQAFLMTHKSFATADEVLDLLFEQFEITPPAGLGTSELDQWKEKRSYARFTYEIYEGDDDDLLDEYGVSAKD